MTTNSEILDRPPPHRLPANRRVVVGDLTVSAISPYRVGEFTATFPVGDGEPQTVIATAKNIETFAAFRRLICDHFGVWPRHDAEQCGRRGRAAWLDEIESTFWAGRTP